MTEDLKELYYYYIFLKRCLTTSTLCIPNCCTDHEGHTTYLGLCTNVLLLIVVAILTDMVKRWNLLISFFLWALYNSHSINTNFPFLFIPCLFTSKRIVGICDCFWLHHPRNRYMALYKLILGVTPDYFPVRLHIIKGEESGMQDYMYSSFACLFNLFI